MSEYIIINDIPYTIADIEKDCWHRLINGAVKGRDPMHFMTIATTALQGIGLRTVVLRKADAVQKTIYFHTDIRSRKCEDLQRHNSISALLYDNPSKIQIKIDGLATIHQHDALADAAWQRTVLDSRKCYLTTQAPSTTTATAWSGLPEHLSSRIPTLEESEAGRANFAVISIGVQAIDWLHLHVQGHRRAAFTYQDNQLEKSEWMIP